MAEADKSLSQINEELRLLKRQQKILSARENFMDFVKYTSPHPEDPNDVEMSTYQNAKHHDVVAAAVEEVVKGNYPFLILTMPPRHGKSELVSRRLPAWLLGRAPDQSVVVATYNDNFAADFGAEVRKIVQSTQFKQVFPDSRLVRGGTAKDRLQTTVGGMATFVGRGGSLTGRGAHTLIIDDLIKDAVEAGSQTIRDQAWEWFTKVAMTRRMGKKSVIMTFTRWHSDDPIGRLTDPENEYYNAALAKRIKIINLPAIAEENDPMGREVGTPLWPEFYDRDFLDEQRALDPLGFESLYQQRPSLMDGDLFKRENVRYYDEADLDLSKLRIYCASDHAVSTAQRADPTVLLTVGVDDQNRIYLIDCWWQKQGTEVVIEAMLDIMRMHKPLQWWAEKGHITKSIGPFLRKRMAETNTFTSIIEVTPASDKATRAQSIAGRFSMGYVYFPKAKWWTEKAINELMGFPNGLHDDFVDALAYIGMGLQYQTGAPKAAAREVKYRPGTFGWFKEQSRQEARRTQTAGWRW